jgi:hypothetical protein
MYEENKVQDCIVLYPNPGDQWKGLAAHCFCLLLPVIKNIFKPKYLEHKHADFLQ